MGGSPRFSLKSIEDWKKIGIGAAIAAVGAAGVYLEKAGLTFDQSTFEGAMSFVIASTLANMIRKFLTNTQG